MLANIGRNVKKANSDGANAADSLGKWWPREETVPAGMVTVES